MDKEKLLKPRFKVIADYPESKFAIGKTIRPNREDGVINESWVTPDGNGYWEFAWIKNIEKYPAIFKKLEWWQEREEKDMPEYIKCVIECRIKANTILKANWKSFSTTKDIAHYNQKPEYWIDARFFEPSTQEDYEAYNKSKQ